jgi:cephalosporin hydroxylase
MIEEYIDKTLNGTGDSDQHLMTLFSIALACKGKNYIELGVRSGTTTKPILDAVKLNDGILHSVDIDDNPFSNEEMLKNTNHAFYKMDAVEYLKMIEGWISQGYERPSFVYIDDWHSYDHVKKELDILDRIISPSAIILIHDLMYGNTQPFYHTDLTLKDGQWANGGPYRAVAELDSQFWEFATLPWNNGLTILRKKYSNKYASR